MEAPEGEFVADSGEPEQVDPREAFRRRLVRAVLAELPMEDARCVALHLVAGLNQAEVARTLGVTRFSKSSTPTRVPPAASLRRGPRDADVQRLENNLLTHLRLLLRFMWAFS
jgi:hypothetical protein